MEATGQWNMQQVYLFMFLSIFDILLWTRVRPNWQKSIWFRNIFICILSGWIGKFQFRKSIKYITNFLRIQQLKVDICSRWRWRIFHFIWHWCLWYWYLYVVYCKQAHCLIYSKDDTAAHAKLFPWNGLGVMTVVPLSGDQL